jgi:hypothetical protein
MNTLYYFASLFIGLGLLALQGLALWGLIEIGYWTYCKLTGKDY